MAAERQRLTKLRAFKRSIAPVAMATLASAALSSVSVQAAPSVSGADKLHRLDVMLKASQARCVRTGVDFRSEYGAFATRQRYALVRAERELRTRMAQRYGAGGARMAYARMEASLIQQYSGEHPWLTCRDLKAVAQGLATVEGSATLLEAADQILPHGRAGYPALSRS